MIEINRKSDLVKANTERSLRGMFISVVEASSIYFPYPATCLCELKVGEYIHFLNDDEIWRFYSSDNPDGFLITRDVVGRKGVYISSYPLNRLILKSTGFTSGKKYYIEETNIYHDKCKVFNLNPKDKVQEEIELKQQRQKILMDASILASKMRKGLVNKENNLSK